MPTSPSAASIAIMNDSDNAGEVRLYILSGEAPSRPLYRRCVFLALKKIAKALDKQKDDGIISTCSSIGSNGK